MDKTTVAEIMAHFHALSKLVPLNRICSSTDYDRAVAVLNQLLDAGGAVEKSPLADIVNIIGNLIYDYEQRPDNFRSQK